MKIALIGSGFIAATHSAQIRNLGHEPALVVGTDLQRTQVFARANGIAAASVNFSDALEADIDAVHICTPPTLHYAMVKAVLDAGKHVICEKPLCLDPGEAAELAALAKSRGVVHAVNFNVRFHEACNRIRQAIREPEFGPLHLIHGHYLQEFHVLPAEHSWRYDETVAGPTRAISEIGSHWIDLARYLTGLEIHRVSARSGNFHPTRYLKDGGMELEPSAGAREITVTNEDSALVQLEFSSGAIGSLVLSEVSHGRSNQLQIEVTGTNRSIWWNNENPYAVHQAGKFTGVNTMVNAFGGGFPDTFHDFFQAVYADIAAGMPAKTPTYPTFHDGAVNTAVTRGIFDSTMAQGAWKEIEYEF